MDYLEEAKEKAKQWEYANNPAPETVSMVQGYALIAIVEELKRYNDRMEAEIDRQELLADRQAERDMRHG